MLQNCEGIRIYDDRMTSPLPSHIKKVTFCSLAPNGFLVCLWESGESFKKSRKMIFIRRKKCIFVDFFTA